MDNGAKLVIAAVTAQRAIAKAFPSTSPEISQMNDLMQKVQAKIMQHGTPGEPQAGPM
jgi:hypothetical protein